MAGLEVGWLRVYLKTSLTWSTVSSKTIPIWNTAITLSNYHPGPFINMREVMETDLTGLLVKIVDLE